MTEFKVWLDDLREPRDTSWIWVASLAQVQYLIKAHPDAPDEMDFDHDLGITIDGDLAPNGYDIIKWISNNHPEWYPKRVNVHSANPVGAANIQQWDLLWRRHSTS